VIGNDEPQVSVAGEVIPGNEFYDYESKYTEGKMTFRIPAQLETERPRCASLPRPPIGRSIVPALRAATSSSSTPPVAC
jgi:hypothetical protein